MKSPPEQYPDDVAHRKVEEFIAGDVEEEVPANGHGPVKAEIVEE